MSKVQKLRAFVNRRLTAAVDEIFEQFERTIAEYEEELEFSSKENHRQRKLLDAVLNPEVRLHRGDVQQLLVVKEEALTEQQEWSSSLDQEDPEPPHIKAEQEELWTSQQGEQLQGLDEADSTSVTVKSEDDDEEKAQASQRHKNQTENREAEHLTAEADGEDCGGSEPARNSDPDSPLQPATHDNTSHSESETDDSFDWDKTKEPQIGLNSLQNNDIPVCDVECNTGKSSVSSSECATSFGHKRHLQKHTRTHTGKKAFNCSLCGKRFAQQGNLKRHLNVHTGEKPISCSVCGKRFADHGNLRRHLTVHTGEKRYCCSVCGKRFAQNQHLRRHSTLHGGERPFSCSVCSKRFADPGSIRRHLSVHAKEKPFSCSLCSKRFLQKFDLSRHMTFHTGVKQFSCSICSKTFAQKRYLKHHLIIHTEEKPFSCSLCDKRFRWMYSVKRHKCVGERSADQ